MKSFRLLVPLVLVLLLVALPSIFAQEPTAEPTVEPTAEAMEATAEATAEVPAATAEVTSEATVEPTAEVMAEATAGDAVVIDGSPAVQPFVQALVEAYGQGNFQVETSGINAAFERFCASEVPLVMSTRFITDEELAACETGGVQFIENVLAYDALVVLLSPNAAPTLACVSLAQLDTVYGVGAETTTVNTTTLSPADPAQDLVVYAPSVNSAAFALARSLLPSGELRGDVTVYENTEDLLTRLQAEDGTGIAFLTFAEYEAIEDLGSVRTLQIQGGTDNTCQFPAQTSFELNSYDLARPALLYLNAAQREDENIAGLFNFANTENGASAVAAEQGLTPASEVIYGRNTNNVTLPTVGRTFSRPASPVTITSAATGTVNVAGSTLTAGIYSALTTNFATEFPTATVNNQLFGQDAAWEAICGGTADVILSVGTATPEQTAACETSNVDLYEVKYLSEALVFVTGSQQADLPTCLTLDQLVTAFAAPEIADPAATPALDTEREIPQGPTNWNQLDGSFPDVPLYVFLPGRSSLEVDWLFDAAGATNRIARSDEEENVDYNQANVSEQPLYRAASVANYEGGGLTMLYWQQYQARLAEETRLEGEGQTVNKVRLLEVDGGNGCVAPSEETIQDGSYPLSLTMHLYFAQNRLTDPVVSAFVWSLVNDATVNIISSRNPAVFHQTDVITARDELFTLIEQAQAAAAAQATAEPGATAEGTAEAVATSEATPAATVEATDEAVATEAAPTAGADTTTEPAATAEATVEGTAEAGN